VHIPSHCFQASIGNCRHCKRQNFGGKNPSSGSTQRISPNSKDSLMKLSLGKGLGKTVGLDQRPARRSRLKERIVLITISRGSDTIFRL
jgi:hypothetical protein